MQEAKDVGGQGCRGLRLQLTNEGVHDRDVRDDLWSRNILGEEQRRFMIDDKLRG